MRELTNIQRAAALAAVLGLILVSAGWAFAGEAPPKEGEPAASGKKAGESEEPKVDPEKKPAKTPDEEPAEKPGEKPAKKPGEKPAEKPGEKPAKPEAAAATEPKTETPAPDAVKPGDEMDAKELAEKRRALRRMFTRYPFEGGRNSHFHSLLAIPPIRPGSALPPATGEVSLSFEATGNRLEATGGSEIDSTHIEGTFNMAYTLTEMVEFHGSVCGALLSGDVNLMWNGASVVPADRGERFRISRLNLGTKFSFLPLERNGPTIWACLDFKIQGTKEDMADSGTPGVAFSFLVTQELGPVWAHLNFGWAIFDGQKNFSSVYNATLGMPESIRVDRIFFWGLAFVLPLSEAMSLAVQSEGNTNGFKDLAVLDSDVHVVSAGFRYVFGVYFLDLAGGAGITEASATWHGRLEIGMFF